ncbi:hypothetical protein SAMN06297280_1480 [Arsukibacterium tuosuense]|uniref:DUF3352 domain-containing protein n=1 Tax=Arsukibacterium tuosuense TaxID=1323745 RepID=A0A285IR99_9GAMM|nr:hypothetical protein [Arsukibacterium tuosuense]SNY49616.1 hypothetical protein SAMN06297280_1480 [Arsukibacterium tuosuense]
MRKLLVAVAIIAGAIYGYIKLSGTDSVAVDHPELEFVPADTVFLSAQLEPVDFVAYLNAFGLSPDYYSDASQQQLAELAANTDEPQLRFVLSLAGEYMRALAQPEQLEVVTGIKPQVRSLSYMVGLTPVMRIELANEDAFWQLFDRAEEASGISHQALPGEGGGFRSYPFSFGEFSAELLISVTDGWGNMALVLPTQSEQTRQLALLTAKPERSIISDNQLANIASDYNLNPNAIGFISFQQLVTGLTTTNGNRLANDIQLLASPQFNATMQPWLAAECQQDLTSITNSWPGMYFDSKITTKAGQQTHVRSKMLVPTSNNETITTLSSIRGFVPNHVAEGMNGSVLSFALGLDMAEFAPAITKIWRGLTQPAYQCPQLAQLQQQMQQANPMAMLAAGAMVHSIQGASVTINNLAMDPNTMQVSAVDAMISVTAKNARSYLEGLKAMVPGTAEITLPADGEELPLNSVLPMLDAFGVTPMLQVNDSHLVVYAGDKGTAQAKATLQQAIQKNGMLSFGMDYAQFFGMMTEAMQASGQPVPEELSSFSEMKMQVQANMDIDEQGVVVHSQMTMGEKE